MSEREAIVAWLREEGARWNVMRAKLIAAGNLGPYLGEPSYERMANAIERGDHLNKDQKA